MSYTGTITQVTENQTIIATFEEQSVTTSSIKMYVKINGSWVPCFTESS